MGISFDCPLHGDSPSCQAGGRIAVPFANPIDGGPHASRGGGHNRDQFWTRSGDTWDSMTLAPSIDVQLSVPGLADKHSHWHGFVRNGSVE